MALKNQNQQLPPAPSARPFLAPNITRPGRLLRLATSGGFLAAGLLLLHPIPWLAVGFFILAAFTFFEAWRGWCLLRACGIKTRF